MAHTPGPWAINGWDIVQQDCDNTFPPLAKACNGNRSLTLEAINANTNLIAAAPELLTALKVAADAIDYAQAQVDSENDRHNLLVRLAQVKRVIAKAEGGDA
jgi:hypothetical protein